MIPGHIRISKAINLHANKDSIFALIANRTRWPQWHPAFTPEGPKINLREIKSFIEIENDSIIIIKLIQGRKTPVINGWQLYQATADSLTLQWYMDFHSGWMPWQKLRSLFYENTYGVLMEQGLGNIKKIVQAPF
ncbi:MAG: hypothetical protein NVS1B13_16420 [Flavisolibacter sp.]